MISGLYCGALQLQKEVRQTIVTSELEIRKLASVVQDRVNVEYRKGPPEACSALDQAGLRDGDSIVSDYLDHNEPGLAFEHLLYMIIEPEFVLTAAQLSVLAAVGKTLGFDDRAWSRVRSE